MVWGFFHFIKNRFGFWKFIHSIFFYEQASGGMLLLFSPFIISFVSSCYCSWNRLWDFQLQANFLPSWNISICLHKSLYRSYDPSVCRAMGVEYVNKKTKYNGIPVYIFELNISSEINSKPCYCREDGECPPYGTFDMVGIFIWLLKSSLRKMIILNDSSDALESQWSVHCHISTTPNSFWAVLNPAYIQIKESMDFKSIWRLLVYKIGFCWTIFKNNFFFFK